MVTKKLLLMRELIDIFGGDVTDLASAARVKPALLQRAAPVLTTEMVLRLAHVTGTSASAILRTTGHVAVADLLEAMYGRPVKRAASNRLPPVEARALMLWRALPTSERRLFATLLTHLTKEDDDDEGSSSPTPGADGAGDMA